MGLEVMNQAETAVSVKGSMREAMLMNLHLRTAGSVLMELMSFMAPDAGALYESLSQFPWEALIRPDGYLSVTSSVDNPTIKDTRFASLRAKDAIVDRIKAKKGRRPDSGPERKGAVVHIYWKGEKCTVFADTSGESLSKRGYRKAGGIAPLRENLAAALVLSTGWDGEGAFVNPMCGSGTLAIEAALIALRRAPGTLRGNFGLLHLSGFDSKEWDALRREAVKGADKRIQGRIIATDIDKRAVEAARSNARTAGVEHLIEFSMDEFASTEVPEGKGVVIMNPPYGERIGQMDELELLYARMGDFLKKKCTGKTGFVFTGNAALAKKIGLRTKSRTIFFNGPMECRLLRYELYEGTRKDRLPPVEGGVRG